MTTITETEVVQACQTLFGNHVNISRAFLHYVQPSGVKAAYRQKAKETHPDLFAIHPPHIQQKQTELFREILSAYDVLNLFFQQREKASWRPAAQAPRQRAAKHSRPTPEKPKPRAAEDNAVYRGNVPKRTLQFGQYLYYRGKISFGALINALIWQRQQRPSIGEIAIRWGLLNAEGVEKISSACLRPRLFGEKAVELGLLSIFQVNTLLLYQRSRQDRLGTYFIRNNILPQEEIDRYARELKEHNAYVLAEALLYRQRQGVYAYGA
jgi:hypothetical protein